MKKHQICIFRCCFHYLFAEISCFFECMNSAKVEEDLKRDEIVKIRARKGDHLLDTLQSLLLYSPFYPHSWIVQPTIQFKLKKFLVYILDEVLFEYPVWLFIHEYTEFWAGFSLGIYEIFAFVSIPLAPISYVPCYSLAFEHAKIWVFCHCWNL